MKKLFLSLIILLAYPQFTQAEEPQFDQANEQAIYYRELAQEEREKARGSEQIATEAMADSIKWEDKYEMGGLKVYKNLSEMALDRFTEAERFAIKARERALEYEKMAFEILANSN